MEWQVEVLDKHTAAAFNTARHAITLSSKETTQMRQVALQNQMALDTLREAQGGSCALVKAQCCVHILDNSHNISAAMKALDGHITVIDSISIKPISALLQHLSTSWRITLFNIFDILLLILFSCCCPYCVCGI